MSESEKNSVADASVRDVVHTPGPWCLCEDVFGENDVLVSADRDASPDGGFPYPVAWIEVEDMDADELRANARLIAAAPKMIEALRAINLATNPFIETDETELHRARVLVQEAIKDAISKVV